MRRTLTIALSILFFAVSLCHAQETEAKYHFTLSGGGGITKNVSVFAKTPDGLDQMGFSGTARLMWHPEFLISAGLETGYTHIYTIESKSIVTPSGTTDAKAVLSAIPIQLALSMPLWQDFDIYAASGVFIVSSALEGFGTGMNETVVSMGNIFSLAWSRPVSESMRIGTEVKWLYMDKFQDNNITLHFMLYYSFPEY